MPRKIATLLLCSIASGGAARAAEPAAPAKTLEADYVITWLGLPVYAAKFSMTRHGDRYRLRFWADAEGIARLAARQTVEWETQGRIAGGEFRPERFEQINTFRRQPRRITIAYAEKGAQAVSIVPPESPGKRPPVPEPLKAGTVDPLSATFAALSASLGAKSCAYTAKVFEGLRRTDVRLEHAGSKRTPVHRVSGLDREAYVCLMHAKRLAGYEEKHFKQNPEPLPPATLWVARHEAAAMWVPAQLRFESSYGPIYARLTRLKFVNGAAP
jgi:hypothetical protein